MESEPRESHRKQEGGTGAPGESNTKVSEARRGTGDQELPVVRCGWGLGCFQGNQRDRGQVMKGLASPGMEVELCLKTLFISRSIKCFELENAVETE